MHLTKSRGSHGTPHGNSRGIPRKKAGNSRGGPHDIQWSPVAFPWNPAETIEHTHGIKRNTVGRPCVSVEYTTGPYGAPCGIPWVTVGSHGDFPWELGNKHSNFRSRIPGMRMDRIQLAAVYRKKQLTQENSLAKGMYTLVERRDQITPVCIIPGMYLGLRIR